MMTLKQLSELPRNEVKIIDNVAQFRREPKCWYNRIYVIYKNTTRMPQRITAYRFGLCEGIKLSKNYLS
jgi:N-acetyl-gamma-glutamylphosphate reductase